MRRALVALAWATILVVGGLLMSWTPALARESELARADHVAVRLIAGVEASGDLTKVPAALDVELDDGWKTYWRSPGEAGLPPALDWTGSTNLAAARLAYPAPERLTVLGLQTFGYKHEVIFPLSLTPKQPGRPLDLRAKVDLLVCAVQCVPETLTLALTIPAGPARPSDAAQTLAKWQARVPGSAAAAGVTITRVAAVKEDQRPALLVEAKAEAPFVAPDVFAELQPSVAFDPPHVTLSADGRTARFVLELSKAGRTSVSLAKRPVTLTLVDGDRALEDMRPIAQGGTIAATESTALWQIMAIALLGGFILNFMPCVLPVLGIKFFTVMSQGGRAPGVIRLGFLASAAGVVVSFLAIALGLIALKAAGQSVGWGIQFQQPAFVAGLAVLVTFFACHLLGLFEIGLPRFIARAVPTGHDGGLFGHFLTGVFATLLSTPCSAPFVGTAIGFAITGKPSVMLAVFLALGLGLAAPYLLVAAVPRLAMALPRPGIWMVWLRKALALPLIATAVWLLTILAAEAGQRVAVATIACLLAIVALLIARARGPVAWRGGLAVIVGLAAVGTILTPAVLSGHVAAREPNKDAIAWRSFDEAAIPNLLAQGKVVFVDVTADWCLTCKANKRFVLADAPLAKRLSTDVVAMQADWTQPNPGIAAYLAGFGRYGIPFNVVYGPRAPDGIILPELLTRESVVAALDQASAGPVKAPPSR
jgi:suppressor for copper-sensitivity B